MDFEIIDFHTHPFDDLNTNICNYRDHIPMDSDTTVSYLKGMGISKICGSVVSWDAYGKADFDAIKFRNDKALELKEKYEGFYVPGFHVHPFFVKESLEEIERMHKKGVNLIGELVPYWDGWSDYSCKEFDEILDLADNYNMVVNFHTMTDDDQADKMVKEHKNIIFVAAHPGEKARFLRHLDIMKISENYHLDLSGGGLFRQGMLRYGIDKCGVEKFIFGSDYPTCNPAMFIGGVLFDSLLTDREKEIIFSGNAKRILNL